MTDPPPDTIAALTVPALLTLGTVARILDCHPRTVKRRIDDGLLPAVVENGRTMVRADDLLAFIERLERFGPPARSRSPRTRKSPYRKL
jgi:hypothetical protein